MHELGFYDVDVIADTFSLDHEKVINAVTHGIVPVVTDGNRVLILGVFIELLTAVASRHKKARKKGGG